jgi:hypothetical protein
VRVKNLDYIYIHTHNRVQNMKIKILLHFSNNFHTETFKVVCPKSNGGVSNDYIVGMKHDRHMKQVSNERQTHQVFHLKVGGTGESGGEGGQGVACATYPR